jgi:hypothetical protein
MEKVLSSLRAGNIAYLNKYINRQALSILIATKPIDVLNNMNFQSRNEEYLSFIMKIIDDRFIDLMISKDMYSELELVYSRKGIEMTLNDYIKFKDSEELQTLALKSIIKKKLSAYDINEIFQVLSSKSNSTHLLLFLDSLIERNIRININSLNLHYFINQPTDISIESSKILDILEQELKFNMNICLLFIESKRFNDLTEYLLTLDSNETDITKLVDTLILIGQFELLPKIVQYFYLYKLTRSQFTALQSNDVIFKIFNSSKLMREYLPNYLKFSNQMFDEQIYKFYSDLTTPIVLELLMKGVNDYIFVDKAINLIFPEKKLDALLHAIKDNIYNRFDYTIFNYPVIPLDLMFPINLPQIIPYHGFKIIINTHLISNDSMRGMLNYIDDFRCAIIILENLKDVSTQNINAPRIKDNTTYRCYLLLRFPHLIDTTEFQGIY